MEGNSIEGLIRFDKSFQLKFEAKKVGSKTPPPKAAQKIQLPPAQNVKKEKSLKEMRLMAVVAIKKDVILDSLLKTFSNKRKVKN